MFSTSPLRPEAFENVRQVAIEALLTNKERVPKQHFDGIMDVLDTTYLPGFHEDDDVACIDIAPGLTTGRTALMPVKPLGTVRVNLTGIKPDNPDDNSRQEVMPRGEHGNAIPEFKFDYKLSNDGRLTSLEKI